MAVFLGHLILGLLLVFIDVRRAWFSHSVGAFDLLADSVGYLLIALASIKLAGAAKSFSPAGFIAFVLTGLDLMTFAPLDDGVRLNLGIGMLILDAVLIWFVLGGIRELARSQRLNVMAINAHHLRIAYALLTVIWMGGHFIASDVRHLNLIVKVGYSLGFFALGLCILITIKRLRQTLQAVAMP
jgi:hypothetical protein